MSGRGSGRGRGGRGQQPSPYGGRGQQPPQGRGGGGSGRGRGTNAPSSSSARSVDTAPATSPAAAVSQEMESKLTLQASSSTQGSVEAQPVLPALPPTTSKALTHQPRPGFGSVGQRLIVKANHFLVSVSDRDLHHYDVSISPDVTSKKICRMIISQLVESYKVTHLGKRMLAYDGRKSAYTAGPLPFTSKDFVVVLADKDGETRREREFKVSIKFASKADLHNLQQFLAGRQLDHPQDTIQSLDVVLRQRPSKEYEIVGRSFFSANLGPRGELGDGLEYWKGFYQSLRPTQMGLSLNIDISARAFYEPISVSDYVAKYLNKDLSRPLSDQDRLKVKKTLRGVRIQINHQKYVKRYKVSGVTTEPATQLMFPIDDSGAKISVAEYFRQKYNIVLQYPFLPAIQAGNESKPIYLPMELCHVLEGQRYSKRLNERQVTALLRATCQRPSDRENNIKKMLDCNDYKKDQLVKDEFGIEVNPQLTSVEARVLPAPRLKYHDTGREALVEPKVGQWNMIDKKMVNGGSVDSWSCISFARPNLDVRRFCEELTSMCCSKGMEFNPTPFVPIRNAQPNRIEKALVDIHSESSAKFASMKITGQLQLLIVILPDISGSYGKIKRICETELGIVSQCCLPKNVSRISKQYLENVSLKINVKVGGRNTVLEQALHRRIPFLSDRPTIVIGADVTHPQPGEDSSPSIAAVVASMDWPEVTKYRGLVSAQAHREEIIQDLYTVSQDPQRGLVHGGMIRELLIAFRNSTGQKPHRIIFYRDGVSEGQFNQVLFEEMQAIRKACLSLQKDYLPRVTFVVVQKRHHTRLFPTNHGDRRTTDRSGNILPGTVVDTKICHPSEFDFYLCSHSGIQGTSRPTHYHVLFDENEFTADAMQMLTNNLCYTYARCTRSVSIVPPAYYAHLAAFRARYYIEGTYQSDGESSSGPRRGATRERSAEVRPLPAIKENVKAVMFYC